MNIKLVFMFRGHVLIESENAKHRATPRVKSNQAIVCSILFSAGEEEEKAGANGCRES